MRDAHLAVIGTSQRALADGFVDAVLAHWHGGPPRVVRMSGAELAAQPTRLGQVHAAWLLLDRDANDPGQSSAYDLIALLQDQQTPAMVSRPGEGVAPGAQVQAGVVAAPFDCPPQTACVILQTLASQAQALRDLQAEIHLLHAQAEGLTGQFDRIDEELRLAAQLQREFLPAHLPHVTGVQFHCLFRPASYVSGDIFDVTRLDENHVGLFIADAVGHGVPAALITVFIKQSLILKEIGRNFPNNYRLVPPHEVLARLNKDMIDIQSESVRTATAWYGLVNVRTRQLQFARAGHPMPLLLRADGSSQYLDSEGALLGVFPDEKFQTATIDLAQGDLLLLYSDGFETAFPQPRGNGRQRHGLANHQYVEEFRQLATGPLDQAISRLVSRLDQQAGSLNQVDDLTVVCVGVESPSASGTGPMSSLAMSLS